MGKRKESKYQADEHLSVAARIVESGDTALIEASDSELVEALSELTDNQRQILYVIIETLVDTSKEYTERQIAKRAGVDTVTLWRARRNPKFQYALRLSLENELNGKLELGIRQLIQNALAGKERSLFALLEMQGLYTPVKRVQSQSMNVNADKATGKMPAEIRRELAKRWKDLDWTPEDFMEAWQVVENE